MNDSNENVYLIVGLGNPGLEYQNTRHNVGFMVLNVLAERLGTAFTRMQHKALVTKGNYEDTRVILAKPRTYMNLSGQSVGSLARYYKVPTENIMIIFDDADLPFETLRMRADGGSSGQKGMKSIIQHLSTENVPRLRVGIDRPPGRMRTPDYVLQDFSKTQQETLPWVLDRAADAVMSFIRDGIEKAMSEYNRLPE